MTGWTAQGGAVCPHAAALPAPSGPADTCPDCLRDGGRWVHLRRCLTCGAVGCCDSSPARHAAAHRRATGHPVVASAEPGERWAWCEPDQALLLPG
ncbi:UBP-type zinc finger domain-containing protein [Modestobacter sp. NPDC049651]|uniref:UBP-type zinc finger domain-containing protein n=1 Tax=unclassified Modestobacter TaxID=2643866 RepID=UPI0033F2EE2A